METWIANALGFGAVLIGLTFLAVSALWRVSGWSDRSAHSLSYRYGLPLGAVAPQVAAYKNDQEQHLSFLGRPTLLVFGAVGCVPCEELINAAANHPAMRPCRLVYLSATSDPPAGLPPFISERWEFCRFHDEGHARERWQAPVSPYFHLINDAGRIIAKGVANQGAHLDRLLSIPPPGAGLNRPEVAANGMVH